MNVKAVVRVRPFSLRQAQLESKLSIQMNGNTTLLQDPLDKERVREFTFDHSFWSHDGFYQDENGQLKPSTDKYVGQKEIYEKVGLEMVNSLFEGYNCSIIAYGQTGAGKTYTMRGNETDKGLIPRVCAEIQKRIALNQDKTNFYQVHASMIQIYNERIQDLLVTVQERKKQGLPIREHRTKGMNVEGLTKQQITGENTFEKLVKQGHKNQMIAATLMSMNTNRSHLILTIELREFLNVEGEKKQRVTVLNLVELGGSEKINKAGELRGDRLKEAINIGKTSVLLNVISCLSEAATDKYNKKRVVPYRDSCLTRYLQRSFGGNCKLTMIFVVSPAQGRHDETLSTLRYANATRKIVNNPKVNLFLDEKEQIHIDLEKEKEKENMVFQRNLQNQVKSQSQAKKTDFEGYIPNKTLTDN